MFRVSFVVRVCLIIVLLKLAVAAGNEDLQFDINCQLPNICFERTIKDLTNEISKTSKVTDIKVVSSTQSALTNTEDVTRGTSDTRSSLRTAEESSTELTSSCETTRGFNTTLITSTTISTAKQLTKATQKTSQVVTKTSEVSKTSAVAMTAARALKSTPTLMASKVYNIHLLKEFDTLLCSPRSVINLKNLIYVLCINPYGKPKVTLRAYEDIYPYDLLLITIAEEINGLSTYDMDGIDNPTTIYVSDHAGRCIWKIDMDNNRVYRWLSEIGLYFSLTVTNDNQLLLLRSFEYPKHLEIYDQHAKLLRSVKISNSFIGRLNAIQKPNGAIIVSHGYKTISRWFRGSKDQSIISVLSTGGQIIEQFLLKEDFSYEEMRLFLDVDSNNLVVVDMQNRHFYLIDLNTQTRITKLSFRFFLDKFNALYYDGKRKQFIRLRPSSFEIFTLEIN